MFNVRNQYCPNTTCKRFQKHGAGNVIIHSKKYKRFQCNNCKKTWVSHRFEIQYGLRTEETVINTAIKMMRQGFSIRKTAKEVQVSPSTIQRWRLRIKKAI
jgi:transposase-like protein